MKNFKKVLYALYLVLATVIFTSCADSKEFVIDNKQATIEPYGWFDLDAKHDSIKYKVNTGNVVLSVIFVETVIVPIILTGDQLYEPVRKKAIK